MTHFFACGEECGEVFGDKFEDYFSRGKLAENLPPRIHHIFTPKISKFHHLALLGLLACKNWSVANGGLRDGGLRKSEEKGIFPPFSGFPKCYSHGVTNGVFQSGAFGGRSGSVTAEGTKMLENTGVLRHSSSL